MKYIYIFIALFLIPFITFCQEELSYTRESKNEISFTVSYGRSFRGQVQDRTKEFYLDKELEGIPPDYEVYRNTGKSNNGYTISFTYNRFLKDFLYLNSSLNVYNSNRVRFPIVSKINGNDFIESSRRSFSDSKTGYYISQGLGLVPYSKNKFDWRIEGGFTFGMVQSISTLDPIYISVGGNIIHQGYNFNELSGVFIGGNIGTKLMYKFKNELNLGLSYKYMMGKIKVYNEFDDMHQLGISLSKKF